MGLVATFDVRLLFDDEGKLLPVNAWPEAAAVVMESFDADSGKVRLPSPSRRSGWSWSKRGTLRASSTTAIDLAQLLADAPALNRNGH